jgi:hypothetical protein
MRTPQRPSPGPGLGRVAGQPGAVLVQADIPCWAEKGCRDACGTIRIPYWGRQALSHGKKAVNRSHAKIRALVEQAVATLKNWRLLRKLRCSTTRITALVQVRLTPYLASSGR